MRLTHSDTPSGPFRIILINLKHQSFTLCLSISVDNFNTQTLTVLGYMDYYDSGVLRTDGLLNSYFSP